MPIVFYTAGYHQRNALPPQAVNIACRPSGLWRKEGTGRSLGCLFPGRAVWAASKAKGDWAAAYQKQLAKHLESGKLLAVVESLENGDVLMCWERDPGDCHRLVAAEFIARSFPKLVRYAGEYWGVQRAAPSEPTLFG